MQIEKKQWKQKKISKYKIKEGLLYSPLLKLEEIMPQNLYEVLWIVIIYAFIGWCTEVSYAALDRGIFVNRGFLNGPCCPIYGFGVLIVVFVLTPIKENLCILFIGSFILTTVLEYMTGYILEKVFHNKWWDYSDKPFNVHGYICLKFSVLWGLACTFIMTVLHPILYGFIHFIPKIIGMIILNLLVIGFFIDFIITVATILKFNDRLKHMEEVAVRLKFISDEIGENIYENVTEAIEKKGQIDTNVKLILEAKKAEYEELSKKYKELTEKKIYGHERLLKAFPGLKSLDHEESLQKVKQHLKNMIKNTSDREK